MALSPADRELLREFWREVRADPVMLWNLLMLVGVVVGGLALVVLVLLRLV